MSFVQHLGAIPFHVDSGRARGPSDLPQAPAVPNPNISGCLRSSPTHASRGQTDHKAFSASARARGYLGTWSVIALQSLPAALKISTSPQHAGTPIFIQKCIWEAEAKTSTGCCRLEKSYYGHCRENIGRKRTMWPFLQHRVSVGCSAWSVASAGTPACSWGSGSRWLRSVPSHQDTFPSHKAEPRFCVRV